MASVEDFHTYLRVKVDVPVGDDTSQLTFEVDPSVYNGAMRDSAEFIQKMMETAHDSSAARNERANKRRRIEAPRRTQGNITFTLQGREAAVTYTVPASRAFESALRDFAAQEGRELTPLRLCYKDWIVSSEDSPAQIGLEDDADILVLQLAR
ncbi:Hypothetical predicted protein [Lecanosticta acicola]|uniref:Ubiquitin-like domain-containing protein n=1 Tax=Lecanosticta acicola TaxID=111012 RepID=A0AAI8Z0D4_9PEZI|nr:Hypothetical predicted protein [Lecanosticta acicola]